MTWLKGHLKIFAVVTLLFLIGVLYLTEVVIGNNFIPLLSRKNPPTFRADQTFIKLTRVAKIGWEVGIVNLTFKETRIGDGNLYLIGTYPDTDGAVREVTIFVGTLETDGSVRLYTNFMRKPGETALMGKAKFEDVTSLLKDGELMQVNFLVNVPEYDKVVKDTTLCKDLPNICFMGERTVPFQATYGGFWYKRTPLPAGTPLNALIVTEL